MSSEIAKIADDLDNFVHDLREEGGSDATALWLEKRSSALRRLAAAGDQKPVAWHSPTDSVTPFVKPHIKAAMLPHTAAQYSVPLYLSNPAAADSNASVEARLREALYRHKKRGTTYRVLHDNAPMQEEQTEGRRLDDEPMVIYQDVNSGSVYVRPVVEFYDGRFEALSHQPDAAEPNASAEARLREAVTRLADVSEAFLRYFNPANDLSSDKEDQWWSVFDHEAGWRDISTAPRDGTVIFVRRDNGCSLDYMVVWWDDTHNDGYPWRSDNNAYVEDRWDEWMLPPIRSARDGGGS